MKATDDFILRQFHKTVMPGYNNMQLAFFTGWRACEEYGGVLKEIPEEISAQHDVTLDYARQISISVRAQKLVEPYMKIGDGGKCELVGDPNELINDIAGEFLGELPGMKIVHGLEGGEKNGWTPPRNPIEQTIKDLDGMAVSHSQTPITDEHVVKLLNQYAQDLKTYLSEQYECPWCDEYHFVGDPKFQTCPTFNLVHSTLERVATGA